MKIIVASTIVPFIEGGGTLIADWLFTKLKEYGHEVDLLKFPFFAYYPTMLDQMMALRLFDLTESSDMLITIRTPSHLLRHPNKRLWFIHHHRGAYDLWNTKYQDIPDTIEGNRYKNLIISSDNKAFAEAKKIFSNSEIVSNRLKEYNNIDSEVLYPPLMNSENFFCNEYKDYIFYPSRITGHKRQHLAIEAMKYTKTEVKLIIAGNPELNNYITEIKDYMNLNNLHDKVKILDYRITDDEKIRLFSDALGCIYIPYKEDSYGYVSLEAYHSKKPVVTCSDSGGTSEIVEDNYNGFITEPDAVSIAEAMDKLYNDKQKAKKMGEAGFDRLRSMNISWDNIVHKLTS